MKITFHGFNENQANSMKYHLTSGEDIIRTRQVHSVH